MATIIQLGVTSNFCAQCHSVRSSVFSSHFHKHFTQRNFIPKCFAQFFSSYLLALSFFGAKILAQKGAPKMLIKLILDHKISKEVNFWNWMSATNVRDIFRLWVRLLYILAIFCDETQIFIKYVSIWFMRST